MLKPDRLAIYLSGRCNLACRYCYSAGVEKRTITAAALRRALAEFAAAAADNPKFTVLGGEPLLCRDRLALAVGEIRRLFGRAAAVHVFTNGLPLRPGEAASLLKRGVKLTVSMDGGPRELRNLPRALRRRVSASIVVTPRQAAALPAQMLGLLELGYASLAWSPDITAAWDAASLRELRLASKELLLEYLRRLKAGRGAWELANGYEAVALAARGERPGPCRTLALAPDGYFYPCDKMLSAPPALLRRFRSGADGAGRREFLRLALAEGVRPSGSMCPAAPWAAARFAARPRAVPAGQAAARRIAARWLSAAAAAGLASPEFRRMHGVGS